MTPALLLHSGGLSGRQWKKLAETLPRALAPDLLGSGSNPPWPEGAPFHLEQDLEALEKLLEPEARFHLVGHSYGGLLALKLALRHPQRVLSVCVYDPVAFGILHDCHDEVGLADLARAAHDPVFLDDARGGSEEWLTEFIGYWNGPGAWQALPPASRESFLRVGRKVYLEVRSLMEDRTGRSDYAKLQAPALVMVGEQTPASAQRVGALLEQALPHAKLVTIQGAGHMGPITHAARVNALIAEHIAVNE